MIGPTLYINYLFNRYRFGFRSVVVLHYVMRFLNDRLVTFAKIKFQSLFLFVLLISLFPSPQQANAGLGLSLIITLLAFNSRG